MPELKDLTGKQFGKWTVIRRVENYRSAGGNVYTTYECRCECGTVRNVFANSLICGRSTSCGCEQKNKAKEIAHNNFVTHGESKTRLYHIWAGIHKRCEDKNATNYYLYGARGITVCDAWHNYEPFRDWAIEHGYTDEFSIDRIDVNSGYSPDNCRWVDRTTQCNNRRSNVFLEYNGETHTIAEWAKIYNVSYGYFHKKLSKNGYIITGELINQILAFNKQSPRGQSACTDGRPDDEC